MIIDVKAPSPGESISNVLLASWLVENGTVVEKDAEIAELESEKATLAVIAPDAGKIEIIVSAGETISPGVIVCKIDTSFKPEVQSIVKGADSESSPQQHLVDRSGNVKITPVARKIIEDNNLHNNLDSFDNSKKRIKKHDVLEIISNAVKINENISLPDKPDEGRIRKEKMSPLRQKLAARLVSVRSNTAMLTTFNEVNMTELIRNRKLNEDIHKHKLGFNIGFVTYFTKAACIALMENPVINAMIEGDEIIYHNYVNISVAVSTAKGLMAPVIRDADKMSLEEIESQIRILSEKARNRRISPEDLSGGTFTLSNGGVFGSMLSTPLINPPQSAILGMHNITDRPIVINGEIKVCPIMYVALSYDHRLIDGKESVGFLIRVKELIEHPHLLTGES